MSRAFHPPNSLSKEEIRTIANVRRDIWTNGFYGMAYGSLTGMTGHTVLSVLSNRGLVKNLKLNRNTAMLSFLLGASLGSFLMASTTGKNQVHNLHPIFDVGKQPPPSSSSDSTPYQTSMAQDADAADRERNRLLRRKTLQQTLENQHGGLNDSHGGRWVDADRHDNRLLRRKTLQQTLENPQGGLNDSHGGRWVHDDSSSGGAPEKHI